MSTFLTPDKTITINGVTVNQKIVPAAFKAPKDVSSWVKKGQNIKPNRKLNDGTGKPRGVCIHNTEAIKIPAGTTMAEQYIRSTYNGNMVGVIVTYYVDDKCAWQLLEDNEQGWHAADGISRKATARPVKTIGGNLDCISFEIIGDCAKANDNAARIAGYLLKKYTLAVDDVYGHIFFSGKNCPMYILKNNGWDKFKNLIRGYI
ncbi:MAG: peptidoglycan recognition protein family protein [Oscillospiraceae bacterium]|jgi:N-acetylmuramoyl-L-alanine amidase|nr:peptidoglycan recognition protein family protein [Oscillospiraceae bacterium]